ncbi:hypothetical protein EXN66_Car011400 [Channa argus]|uniref:Uncharacterized protein n=1 Tax=Channa argus TaxID=215402 RepID=A0A6G1Q000_CHAAH|nr:hypothetical protein EXN66_Car011400 [Channa argus]
MNLVAFKPGFVKSLKLAHGSFLTDFHRNQPSPHAHAHTHTPAHTHRHTSLGE